MTRNERLAWKQFLDKLAGLQFGALDGCVPIAAIALPVKSDLPTETGLIIDVNAAPVIVWPAEIPEADRGPIIQRIAEAYRTDKVNRV